MPDPATYRPAPGSIPVEPGVYRFRDQHGRVIYVGKAKSLRSRLTSYFADVASLHPRTRQMVTTAAKVEWTVVTTEVEALQLEYNWIKEFDPRFNVRYRDDKTYPVLAATMNEEFPRLHVYRGPRRKGVRYFGPYAHAWAIRETLDLLLRVFPARTCSAGVFKRRGQRGWVIDKVEPTDTAQLVERLLTQFYGEQAALAGSADDATQPVPREILVPELPPEAGSLTEWLSGLRGSRVQLRVPHRGDK